MAITFASSVEKWCVYEVSAPGRTEGNPFTDYTITAFFTGRNEQVTVDGFYDGDGIYRVRFMPSFEGEYTFSLSGTFGEGGSGCFTVTPARTGNHGPVRVANRFHFAYEDGTPYFSIGTTCYVWTHQKEALRRRTLETLKNSAFNKIRFCVFPKHYIHNFHDPETFPYEGTPVDTAGLTEESFLKGTWNPERKNDWDFTRFNPEHFRRLEQSIQDLQDLGIEADIIVMHPYDRWGFSEMSAEQDDLYWRYIIARFAAYRNVWWSLANEYDLLRKKTLADWERYAAILCEKDPYSHLRSVHNCISLYDFTRPWVTHCSVQRTDVYKTCETVNELRVRYGKPVVMDEICYEGDIDQGWGNISGEEMIRRFWEATVRGGYAGHGETYMHPEDILWWSHGGELHGTSGPRLKFLAKYAETLPAGGLKYEPMYWDAPAAVPEEEFNSDAPSLMLFYFGFNRPRFRVIRLPEGTKYTAELIDTWNMTVETSGPFEGSFRLEMPGHPFMAVCLRRVEP